MPVFKKLTDTYDPAQYDRMIEAFRFLDNVLEVHDYVTGDNLTIADLALVASVTTAEVILTALCINELTRKNLESELYTFTRTCVLCWRCKKFAS